MPVALWMIVGAAFGCACGFAAIPRNRSAVAWWAAGTIAGPVALGILLLRGKRHGKKAIL